MSKYSEKTIYLKILPENDEITNSFKLAFNTCPPSTPVNPSLNYFFHYNSNSPFISNP